MATMFAVAEEITLATTRKLRRAHQQNAGVLAGQNKIATR